MLFKHDQTPNVLKVKENSKCETEEQRYKGKVVPKFTVEDKDFLKEKTDITILFNLYFIC